MLNSERDRLLPIGDRSAREISYVARSDKRYITAIIERTDCAQLRRVSAAFAAHEFTGRLLTFPRALFFCFYFPSNSFFVVKWNACFVFHHAPRALSGFYRYILRFVIMSPLRTLRVYNNCDAFRESPVRFSFVVVFYGFLLVSSSY